MKIVFMKLKKKPLASRCTPVTPCNHCIRLNSKVIALKMLYEKEKEIEKLKTELEGSKIQKK